MVPVDYYLVCAFLAFLQVPSFFTLIFTEPIVEGTSLALARHSHYVNQESLLQKNTVAADLESVSIRDDMGFGAIGSGMSSDSKSCI